MIARYKQTDHIGGYEKCELEGSYDSKWELEDGRRVTVELLKHSVIR